MIKSRYSALTRIKMDYDLYLMLLLPVMVIIIFRYIPMIWTLIAFQDFNLFAGLFGSKWVGFDNFIRLFNSHDFLKIFRNTLLINLYRILWLFPMPILFALLLNEVKNRLYKRVVQTIVYIPHFLSWVIVSGLFLILLKSDGIVNQLLESVGMDKVNFLISSKWFRTINVIQGGWRDIGFAAIIYISAMASVDPQIYEAAKIDGAGRIKQIWYVTLPGIASTIVLMLLLRIANITNSSALLEQILNMYNPAVYETADIIGTYVFRNGLGKMTYSYNAAMDMFSSIIGCTLIIIGNKVSAKLTGRSIW